MKTSYWLMIISLAVLAFVACEKENITAPLNPEDKSVVKSGEQIANTTNLYLNSISQGGDLLYLSASHTGGEKQHSYAITWNDIQVVAGGDSLLAVGYIKDLTTDDAGQETVYDSTAIGINDFIGTYSGEWNYVIVKLVNAANTENVVITVCINPALQPIVIDPIPEPQNPVDSTIIIDPNPTPEPPVVYYIADTVTVISGDYNLGIWGDKWLKPDRSGDFQKYVVISADSLNGYIPELGERVEVVFQRNTTTYIDSTIVSIPENHITPIDIIWLRQLSN